MQYIRAWLAVFDSSLLLFAGMMIVTAVYDLNMLAVLVVTVVSLVSFVAAGVAIMRILDELQYVPKERRLEKESVKHDMTHLRIGNNIYVIDEDGIGTASFKPSSPAALGDSEKVIQKGTDQLNNDPALRMSWDATQTDIHRIYLLMGPPPLQTLVGRRDDD